MFGQSKTGDSSQITFIALFSSTCTALLSILLASANCAHRQEKNHFPEPNRHMLTFLHPILKCRASPGGDALSGSQMHAWSSHYTIHGHIDKEVDILPRFCIGVKACSLGFSLI